MQDSTLKLRLISFQIPPEAICRLPASANGSPRRSSGGLGVGGQFAVGVSLVAEVVPARGVYVTRTHDLESARVWSSITNIGYRPTFGESEQLTVETFLLEPLEGEAPRRIGVEFLWRVRHERKFDSPEALKAQILKDARLAQAYFRRVRRWTGRPRRPAGMLS